MKEKIDVKKIKDPKYYLENFCKIKTKKRGLWPFKLNEAQKDLFNTIRTESRVMILKARQLGFSTGVTGFFYHDTIMNPGTTTALIGYNSSLTAELLDKVKTFWRTSPKEVRPEIYYNSKYEISFPKTDSKIIVLPSTENVGRGYTIHNCLVTELSAWDKADEKMMVLEASVPVDGRLVIESTPRGQGNLYHRMWMDDNNGYVKKKYGWWWGYTKEDIEVIRRRIGSSKKFAQEYGLQFLTSGNPVFDHDAVELQRKNVLNIGDMVQINQFEFHTVHEEDYLRIYRPPEKGGIYVCGADVSEGMEGGDYSTAIFWDRRTGEEVAFFRGLLPPDRFGDYLDKWGRHYHNALMAVEINNHGLTTVTRLRDKVYPSLYFRPAKFENIGKPFSDKIGWRTTRVTRPKMIDEFAAAIKTDLTIHSKELVDELSVFSYDSMGNMSAPYGFNDDCIFAAAIGLQAFQVLYDKPLDQLDYSQHLPVSFAY